MAKVLLIALYDDWAIGIRTLSNALKMNGHEPVIIHFKLPSAKALPHFLRGAKAYTNLHSWEAKDEFLIKAYQMDANPWTEKEIGLLGKLVKEIRPDIIGMTTRCVYEDKLHELTSAFAAYPSAIRIAGGYGATFAPEHHLNFFDLVCRGEGEESMLQLAEAVDRKQLDKLSTIPNLALRAKDQIVFNEIARPKDEADYFYIPQMIEIIHYVIDCGRIDRIDPYLRDVGSHAYPSYYNSHGGKDYYTMAGRGCHGDCSFCSVGNFYKLYRKKNLRARRMRPIENIMAELRVVRDLGFTTIFFMDSFFLASPDYLTELFNRYREEIKLPFFAQFLPKQIMRHPEILDKAHEAGARRSVVGIQTGSEKASQELYKREMVHADIIDFARLLCQKKDLLVDYHLITHNPYETEEDFLETVKLIRNLPKDNSQLVLNTLNPLTGTEMGNLYNKPLFTQAELEEKDRQFIMYLIRYRSSDEIFEEILQSYPTYSVEDLKKIYREMPKLNFAHPAWLITGANAPRLLEEDFHRFNLVVYLDTFWAIPMALGHLDIAQKDNQNKPGLLQGNSLSEIKEKVLNYEKSNGNSLPRQNDLHEIGGLARSALNPKKSGKGRENEISYPRDKMGHEERMAMTAKQDIPERSASSELEKIKNLPILMKQGVKGFNIVLYKQEYHAISQEITDIDFPQVTLAQFYEAKNRGLWIVSHSERDLMEKLKREIGCDPSGGSHSANIPFSGNKP